MFRPVMDTPCFPFRSEGRAKAKRRESECRPSILVMQKGEAIGCHFCDKKVVLDDNNNYNYKRRIYLPPSIGEKSMNVNVHLSLIVVVIYLPREPLFVVLFNEVS